MLLIVLRLSLFLFSVYGFSRLFIKWVGLAEKISWIAACSAISLTLYVSAYVKLLFPTAVGLAIVGCLFGLYQLYQSYLVEKNSFPLPRLMTIWLGVYFLLFSWTLLNSGLEHYDNYSHWAVIVKFLFTEGRLPEASDVLISFSSYPMGSSLFIYFATVIAGFSAPVMLMGQFVFIFSCIYALFVVVRDSSRQLVVAMMFAVVASFNYFNIAIRVNNLLVDFLLPLLTLAGLAGIFYLQKKLGLLSLYTILVAGSLSLVKNSALFFVVVLLLYYVYTVIKMRSFSRHKIHLIITGLGSVLLSFLPYLLWSHHVNSNFTQSKHDVSLTSYQQIFAEKDGGVTQAITDLFLSTITDVRTPSTQGIILANVLLFGGYLIIRFVLKRKNQLLKVGLLVDGIVIAYYIGIYLMFLFSMPTEEALYLAGFERYASSIVILVLGIAMMALAREMDYSFYEQNVLARNYRSFKSMKTKKWYQYSTVTLLLFSSLLVLSENNGMIYNKNQYLDSLPAQFDQVVGNQMVLNDDRYLVVSDRKADVDSYAVGFIGQYYLYTPNVVGREDFVMDDQPFLDVLKEYDYIVILDDHFTFNAMTEKLFNQSFEPGVYRTTDVVQTNE